MKLTNAIIYDLIGALNKFGNAKGKPAFVIFRTLRKLQDEIKDCDEQKNKLIQKYGKEIDGGIGIAPDDEEANKKFFEEFYPILLCEIDVNIPQMSEAEFNMLEDIEAPEASVNDFALLDAFLVEHPETKKDNVETVSGEVATE